MERDDDKRWYHCILTTYGSWLPGDPRGFRTRHHREHIEGDYKNPPPKGMYAKRLARSRSLQKHDAVRLTASERRLLGAECVRQFRERAIEAIALAVAGQHVHVQFRRNSREVITTLGVLKRAMWYARKTAGEPGRLWGRGRKVIPIESCKHQTSAFAYILDHRQEGAWVWCFRDGFEID